MNITEAGAILGIAAGYDRYIVLNDLSTAAWHTALEDYDYEDVRSAAIYYYVNVWDGKAQLAPRALLDDVKSKWASDVATARRAGLVDRNWPVDRRLPDAVTRDVKTYRQALNRWNTENPIGLNHHETFSEWCSKNGYVFESKAVEAL